MLGTKEYYDLIAAFERDYNGTHRLDKEPKELWSKGNVYQHGELNLLWRAFERGVSFGKLYYRD